jgi:hypothetical protein
MRHRAAGAIELVALSLTDYQAMYDIVDVIRKP